MLTLLKNRDIIRIKKKIGKEVIIWKQNNLKQNQKDC